MKIVSSSNELNERKQLSAELAMGGQAVIEGVMMRSPKRVAVAVRRPTGEIAVKTYPYIPVIRRSTSLKYPVIRGAVGMIEALKIGMDALNWSAEQAASTDEVDGNGGSDKRRGWLSVTVSVTIALVFGLGLFMYVPYWIAKLTVGGGQGQLGFHLVAGAVRILILLLYLWIISRLRDIHRVFQYHGSEHKTIFAFESGVDLTPENVLKQTRFHPRCGTSFLLIVALTAIVFFVLLDTLIVSLLGAYPNVLTRFLVHLPLIPIVAGLSYELLKSSAKHVNHPVIRAFIQPGLWLQRITTQEPDTQMCEVAIAALNAALADQSTLAEPPPKPVPEAI